MTAEIFIAIETISDDIQELAGDISPFGDLTGDISEANDLFGDVSEEGVLEGGVVVAYTAPPTKEEIQEIIEAYFDVYPIGDEILVKEELADYIWQQWQHKR